MKQPTISTIEPTTPLLQGKRVVFLYEDLEKLAKFYQNDARIKMKEGLSRQGWMSEGISDFIYRHLLKTK